MYGQPTCPQPSAEPLYTMPTKERKPPLHWSSPSYEKTLAIIKPDGMQYRDAIVRRINQAGYQILDTRIVKLTMEQATEFYKNTCDMDGCTASLMVTSLSSGPIQAMVLSKVNAIGDWLELMGPETYLEAKLNWPGCLRAIFADPIDTFKNAVHGSKNEDVAAHEIHFFFPNIILEPIMNSKEQIQYLSTNIFPLLMDGLHDMTKRRPADPLDYLAQYLLDRNPGKPQFIDANADTLRKISSLENDEGSCIESVCDSEFITTDNVSAVNFKRPICPPECEDIESMYTFKRIPKHKPNK